MAEPGTPSRRLLWIVVLLLAAGALALWGSSRLTWAVRDRDVPGSRRVTQDVLGADIVPALVPLALLALAGIAAVVATGGWVRRLLGVVVVLAGVAGLFSVLQEVSGPWTGRVIALAGGLALLAAGVLLVVAARGLPRLGAAYSAPGRSTRPVDDDAHLWQALSEGDDPTARG